MKISHVLTFPVEVFLYSFFALQTKTKICHQYPCGSSILICTINLTLTSFYALILLIKWMDIENMSYLVFSPCHYGFSYLDMGLTQIPWCWLAITSPGADLPSIPLCSLANWNMWLFIIENEPISIPGQLKITMHLSCQTQSYRSNLVVFAVISVWPHLNWEAYGLQWRFLFYSHVTLPTTKIFVNIHDLESMWLVNHQQQLGKVSQSRQISQLTIRCHTYILH